MSADRVSRRDFLAAAGAGVAGAASLLASAHDDAIAASHDQLAASRDQPGSVASEDPARLTVRSAADRIRRGVLSPVDLTRACLGRIERLNPSLNAFITVTAEEALATAREREAEQRAGKWRGPLHGIPIALKDNIDTAGTRTTAASALFEHRIPEEDADVVRRLKKAGAVLIGKTNLQEFAYGGTSTVSHYGPVHNPWALERIAGGSSGGSAAAVARDLCLAAIGTDTAGSVRIPASFCGVVGLKPTYGRISNRGVIPLSWTHDHVGTLTKNVEDAALVLQAVAGYDPADPATPDVPVDDYARALGRKRTRIVVGIPRVPFYEDLDPDVGKAVERASQLMRRLDVAVTPVDLPPAGFRSSGLYVRVRGPEAYAWHARSVAATPEKYQEPTRAALLKFADTKADDYAHARHETDRMRREILATFSRVEVIVTPTMPVPPILIADSFRDMAVDWRNTVPFSSYGVPAISIPCGLTGSGLPVGLQIAAAPFAESRLLAFALAMERLLGWRGLEGP